MLTNNRFDTKILTVQQCPVIWFVGLSGAGKSTLANGLSSYLNQQGLATYLLDGDELRKGMNKDLGFSEKDRNENLRRAAELAKHFQNAGVIPICSFISPTKETRKMIAHIIGANFYEVFVNCAIAECEKRDVKGLYKKARQQQIPDFTGISAPFEAPENSFITLHTDQDNYNICLQQLIDKLNAKNVLFPSEFIASKTI